MDFCKAQLEGTPSCNRDWLKWMEQFQSHFEHHLANASHHRRGLCRRVESICKDLPKVPRLQPIPSHKVQQGYPSVIARIGRYGFQDRSSVFMQEEAGRMRRIVRFGGPHGCSPQGGPTSQFDPRGCATSAGPLDLRAWGLLVLRRRTSPNKRKVATNIADFDFSRVGRYSGNSISILVGSSCRGEIALFVARVDLEHMCLVNVAWVGGQKGASISHAWWPGKGAADKETIQW